MSECNDEKQAEVSAKDAYNSSDEIRKLIFESASKEGATISTAYPGATSGRTPPELVTLLQMAFAPNAPSVSTPRGPTTPAVVTGTSTVPEVIFSGASTLFGFLSQEGKDQMKEYGDDLRTALKKPDRQKALNITRSWLKSLARAEGDESVKRTLRTEIEGLEELLKNSASDQKVLNSLNNIDNLVAQLSSKK